MTFKGKHPNTPARINLGRVGPGMPTKAWLDFAYAHAQAKDAVDLDWDTAKQARELEQAGIKSTIINTVIKNREQYLMRPDQGAILDQASQEALTQLGPEPNHIALVASNGLSSLAVSKHLTPFIGRALANIEEANLQLAHNRVFLVQNARVNVIDSIGDILNCAVGIVIIGERPGLSSFDSLGLYLTYKPHTGRLNADRNCISNIRPPIGLSYDAACQEMMLLIRESLHKKLSGVRLKIATLGDRKFLP